MEVWIIANLFVSIVSIVIVINIELPKVVVGIILYYSFIRFFEITVYQVNVLLFDQYKNSETYKVSSYRRLVILLFHNYFLVCASYTVLTYTFWVFDQYGNVWDMLLFSFITIIFLGSNSITEISSFSILT